MTSDSEGFEERRVSVEYFPRYIHGDQFVGIRAGDYFYWQGDWSRHGQKFSILARQLDPSTQNGWAVDGGAFHEGRHALATLDGNVRVPITTTTAWEGFTSRDWVETPRALDAGIHYTFAGMALEQQIGRHVTVIGVAGQQYFSDGNRRDHGRLRIIYQPSLELGLTIQARFRTYHSTHLDVGHAYFNPEHYRESLLAVGWRHRFHNWMSMVVLGLGREIVNGTPSEPTQLVEVSLQSPLYDSQFVRMRAGYNRSASYFGPDYRYRYVAAEWILRF
ncbi:hypothetical protein [Burkholderia territorii]|nr:hypothetical protein [Burkholderia territorii]